MKDRIYIPPSPESPFIPIFITSYPYHSISSYLLILHPISQVRVTSPYFHHLLSQRPTLLPLTSPHRSDHSVPLLPHPPLNLTFPYYPPPSPLTRSSYYLLLLLNFPPHPTMSRGAIFIEPSQRSDHSANGLRTLFTTNSPYIPIHFHPP